MDSKAVQDWYANRLREHTLRRYRAYLASAGGEDPPDEPQLGHAARKMKPDQLPAEARAAYDHYKTHIMDEDIGSVGAYRVPTDLGDTLAVARDHGRR